MYQQGCAGAGFGFDLHRAADQGQPLAHTDQAKSRGCCRRAAMRGPVKAFAVVFHNQTHFGRARLENNADPGRLCMIGNVEDSLLQRAIKRGFDGRRQAPPAQFEMQIEIQRRTLRPFLEKLLERRL